MDNKIVNIIDKDFVPENAKSFCIALSEVIKDEADAVKTYHNIMGNELSNKELSTFLKIIMDEAEHHKQLIEIWNERSCDVVKEIPSKKEIEEAKRYGLKLKSRLLRAESIKNRV